MAFDISIALDRRALRRDLSVFAGDDFSVSLTAYQKDGDPEPFALAGETLELVIWRRGYETAQIPGTGSTIAQFDVAGSVTQKLQGRWYWRVMQQIDVKRMVLVGGVMNVFDPDLAQ